MGRFEIPDGKGGSAGVGYGVSERPNIIWLMTDQHRHHAQGFAGDPNLHTPNLDNLAQMGLTCERGGVGQGARIAAASRRARGRVGRSRPQRGRLRNRIRPRTYSERSIFSIVSP